MHSCVSHSSDEGWGYFFFFAYCHSLLPAHSLIFKKEKKNQKANEDASHIGLSLHSTIKCLRCVIGNLKLDGWALKASAVVKCQSASEQ